jgi:hypothetical protein
MSYPETSPTRGISSWWKNLKKHSNLSNDSLDSSNQHIDDVVRNNRPTLNFKSRSLTAVKPNFNDSSSNEQLIRQQRDEFMASQNKFGFGNEVFGVPLDDSIKIAESLISVPSDDPDEFIKYGKIPLLVGKCGSYLKEHGLKVEGIFRVAGASRRVKELQFIFSTQPDYGRKLDWEGYTVHDAASLFRRFLNNLPEPLVPLELYQEFREPVKSRHRILNHIKSRNDSIERRIRTAQQQSQQNLSTLDQTGPEADTELDENAQLQKQKDARKQKRIAKDLRNALKEYRNLIDRLPQAQKHLLYYLLDMLTMFSENAKENLMSARNLAAIFQPSILSHPDHDLNPGEYALSQAVVEVLIEYSKRLLPDVKKFASDSKRSSLIKPSETDSNKNSSANLLAVRNSAKGSRPHSRSLSSANGVPDSLAPNTSNEDADEQHHEENESSEDEDEQDISRENHLRPLEIPKITKTPSTGTKELELSSADTLEERVKPQRQGQRPVSMFPGSLDAHHANFEAEREPRSIFPKSGGDDFLNAAGNKKGSWFRRLRSSSRSND